MKLLNFKLESLFCTITLIGLDCEWDLHNFAEFKGFNFEAAGNSLLLKWIVPPNEKNPWGFPANKAKGCNLIFYNVESFQMSERDNEYPLSEDVCLSHLSKVMVEKDDSSSQIKEELNEDFSLSFEFESGRMLEIKSESVELQEIV